MATTAVEIVVRTLGTQKLERLEKSLKGLSGDSANAARSLDKVESEAKQAGNAAGRAAGRFGKLSGSLKGVIAAAAGFQIGKKILQVGIDSVESERRLRALAGTFGEIQEAELAASKIADKFGLSQREAAKGFAQIYARLRPIGIELKDIESAYAGFETSARLSGASAQEASAAFLQLTQALGSGVLRGEELNSIFEQTPGVVKAIADEMGAPIGQIRKLASEGKITSDIVLRALKRLEREGVNQLAEAMNGPRQKFKDFSNSVETLSNALATTVLPELSDAISEVGETILLLEGPIKFISGLLNNALREVNSLIRKLTQTSAAAAEADIRKGLLPTNFLDSLNPTKGFDSLFGVKQLFGEEKYEELRQKAREYARLRGEDEKKVFLQFAQDALAAMDGDDYIKSVDLTERPQTRLPRDGNDKGTKTITDRLQPLEQLFTPEGLESIKTRTQEQLIANQLKINDAINAGNKELIKSLEIEERLIPLKVREEALREALAQLAGETQRYLDAGYSIDQVRTIEARFQKDLLETQNALRLTQLGITGDQLREDRAITDEMKKQANIAAVSKGFAAGAETDQELTEQAKELDRLYKGIGKTIQTGIVDAISTGIEGLIKGTQDLAKSLQEIAAGVLADIGKALLQFGVKAGLNALGGGGGIFGNLFGGGFAEGGRPPVGKVSLVGEQGPELFVPDSSGTILSNEQSVSALSRFTPGNSANPFEGVGNRASDGTSRRPEENAPMNFNFNTIRIADEEYVSTAQLQAAMAQAARSGAKQGEAATLRKLQMSPSTRRKVAL